MRSRAAAWSCCRAWALRSADSERKFLSPAWSDGRAKNVSLDGDDAQGRAGRLRATCASSPPWSKRFAESAASLVTTLFPRYAPYVKRARTSFRPQPAVGPRRLVAQGRFAAARRRVSVAAESRRAHPARVHQRESDGAARVARRRTVRGDGEDDAAAHPSAAPGLCRLLAALHVTKGRRSDTTT